jgi:hypothetical protein
MNRSSKLLSGLAVLLLVATAAYLVGSVTRTISDARDNKDSLIRNSKGNYWEPLGSNIQLAIDDLGTAGGTVWVGSAVNVSSTVIMKSKVQLDLQGNTVTMTANVPFVNFKECMWASLKNAYIRPSTYHSTSLILMESGNSWSTHCRNNLVDHVEIVEPSAYTVNHDWTGIQLLMNGDSDICFNTFRDMYIYGCDTGILI